MKRLTNTLVLATAALSMAFVCVAIAGDAEGKPDCAGKQANLLEKFGDQGIDADGDGVVSHEEVKAFFAEKHGAGEHCMQGAKEGTHHGMGCGKGHGKMAGMHHGAGCGGGGKGGAHHGKTGGLGMLLEHLAKLDAPSAPDDLDLETHPGVDADGDGEVSDDEWTSFSDSLRPRLVAHLLSVVPEADTDGDELLSEEELAALVNERNVNRREHVLDKNPEADTDGDGMLSDAELEAFHGKRAAGHREMILKHHPEADTDGDGTVSEEEAQALMGGGHGGAHGGCCSGKAGGECPHAKKEGHVLGSEDKDPGHGCKHQ